MPESPDTPWKRDDSPELPKLDSPPPTLSAIFFHNFLSSNGISGGRFIDIGCGNGANSVFFVQNGFEVYALERTMDHLELLAPYGVHVQCHDPADQWYFSDAFFDVAMDILTYSKETSDYRRLVYRTELGRSLKSGGYYMLSVPETPVLLKTGIENSFLDFLVLKEEQTPDGLRNFVLLRR